MPLKTLTRQEFLRKRPGGDFRAYLRFIRRERPRRLAARNAWRTDPFAQIPEREITRIARSDVMPSVRAQQQAIEQSIERRSRSGIGQIRGFTDALMQALAPYDARIAGYYGDAQASTAAIGDALRSALAGGGGQQASELGGKLAAINAPAAQIEDVAGGARRTGEGAAGATFGLSSAELGRLTGERTAHGAYAAKQPGIAALSGLQSARALELALSGELADRVGELRAGAPGLISDRISELRNVNFDRGLARASGLSDAQAGRIKRQQELADDRRTRQEKLADAKRERQQELEDAARERQEELGDEARERQQELEDAQRKNTDPAARADYFYEVRADAFKAAKTLAQPRKSAAGRELPPMPRGEARRRLFEEYGRMLIGRGYPRQTVRQMIERALDAAGL